MHHTRPTFLSFYLSLLIISMGCTPTSDSDAEVALVPDSIMAEIFIEFHLMEARSDLFNEDMIRLRDSVFHYYGVDTLSYERTMEYYAQNPEVYMKVYSGALDKLSDERYSPED